jgi:dihydrofolate synthase/folylpolyglutamate synthase
VGNRAPEGIREAAASAQRGGDPLAYLFSLERLGMKFGLENISRLCAALGNPHHAFQSVIIGGTNGKGSVTAMVERGLRAAGHRAARYTSPHLTRLEERYVIDGREVPTEALRQAAGRVQAAAGDLIERGVLDAHSTFFECATAIAFLLFRDAAVQVAVLEVGLGGRLDATNVVTPIAAAITSIDLDHQAQLGDTIASIAREKAGIIKPGIPVVCGPVPAEAGQIIRDACEAVGATLVSAVQYVDPDRVFDGLRPSLQGAHQRVNASVAVVLLRQLDALGLRMTPGAIQLALTDVDWPGRLEELTFQTTPVLLDAAHNPAGARALAAHLRDIGWTDSALLFGVMNDKDARAILSELMSVCGALVCTTAPSPRAVPAEDLARIARQLVYDVPVEAVADPIAALARARSLHPRVVAAGSIFLIGPLRDILRAS